MIYVFNAAQRLEECCGCPITQDGLLTLAVNGTGTVATTGSLNTNPLNSNQAPMGSGVIRIVSAEPNGCDSFNSGNGLLGCQQDPKAFADVCDATGGTFPAGQYPALYTNSDNLTFHAEAFLTLTNNTRAWATHVQNASLTESEFANDPLTQDDANNLAEACGDIQFGGSGRGVCSCGTSGIR